ncbi:TIGR03089 family protein [Corynebacterium guangdongense]|uniref:Uncharacterized protein (TIGR03089 family) n=1 Tax=Corynebacterium guangdongense TaxID=1783348 RepID=A0ABU1ZUS9_9CORY|nr:TIGR03089 family protein [Corynebacterium guangdongense]MDR7328682.1 uncharacterized protein (TIGR03089 family) [Corynebacterium guangdongense]WJZ17259.1 hypothetical protein CGUA_03315 [Corynebacterium guangdongense]
MRFFAHLLSADPASPRLTVYDESTGARMDFSAQTLDNWTSKIANMLEQELDLTEGSTIAVDMPVSWQAAVTVFGALAIGIEVEFTSEPGEQQAVFTVPDRFEAWANRGVDVLLVSADPFGRGIEESGGTLPVGALDFGPVVRFYGDQFFGESHALPELVDAGEKHRLLSTGWSDRASFEATVLAPLAAGGSAVVVAGVASAERLEEIAASEKVSARA